MGNILIGFGINVLLLVTFYLGYRLGKRNKTVAIEVETTKVEEERIKDLQRQQDELLNYNIDKVYGG